MGREKYPTSFWRGILQFLASKPVCVNLCVRERDESRERERAKKKERGAGWEKKRERKEKREKKKKQREKERARERQREREREKYSTSFCWVMLHILASASMCAFLCVCAGVCVKTN